MTGRIACGARPAVLANVALLIAAAFFGPVRLAAAEDLTFTGIVESSLHAARRVDADGDAGEYAFGMEQYANLRMEARAGEKGTIHAAANLAAASGSSVPLAADGTPMAPFVGADGYAAALELERLYFRIEQSAFDAEAGLLRLAFGFGQAWSPSDFLAKRNPLLPDARARGILAAVATAYPSDDWQGMVFAVAGRDPLSADGEGAVAGASAEYHGRRGSLQFLYAVQTASTGVEDFVHRWGFSVKADAVVGLALDALYTLDGKVVRTGDWQGLDWKAHRGLAATLGCDWSLLGGDLYLLAQYLYSGGGSLSPDFSLDARGYLYAAATYRLDDYTQATLDCGASLDDRSVVPSLTLSHEPFQGMALSVGGRVPMDERTFSPGLTAGEFGPAASGMSFAFSAKARLRF